MVAIFSFAVFLNAFLLFQIQPMVARMLLPSLGGVPAVWNTCMVFFQVSLLIGYGYANTMVRFLGIRRQTQLHLFLFLVCGSFLPFNLPGKWGFVSFESPIWGLLTILGLSIGLPFIVISAGSPLFQRWFASLPEGLRLDPYRLSMAGNLGSLIALISYPLVIEPYFSLGAQARLWTGGFLLLLATIVVCSRFLILNARANPSVLAEIPETNSPPASLPSAGNPMKPFKWMFLAFIPSSLFLGETTYISTDLAAIPLFWIVPLGLYLISFIVVFSEPYPPWHSHVRLIAATLFIPFIPMILRLPLPLWLQIPWHLGLNFFLFLVFHGELAIQRPPPAFLTSFYLWMSIGGAMGGIFNALAAPNLFSLPAEYPLILALAIFSLGSFSFREKGKTVISLGWFCGLGIGLIGLFWLANVFSFSKEPGLRIGLLGFLGFFWVAIHGFPRFFQYLMGFFLLGVIVLPVPGHEVLYRERSFFGILAVHRLPEQQIHLLIHGNILHGFQSMATETNDLPLGYYVRMGPIGQVFAELARRDSKGKIAVIGLGSGCMASYASQNRPICFFEIDQSVVNIAWNPALFTYVTHHQADLSFKIGDGRLTLAQATETYQLIVLDAYSSDSIPIHLLTKQALEVYLSKLGHNGFLVFHISNRFFNLEPVLAAIAKDLHLQGRIQRYNPNQALLPPEYQPLKEQVFPSSWVILTPKLPNLGNLQTDSRWKTLEEIPGFRPWTDDFSNILGVWQRN
ncbi:MAG: hypothetical protein WA705_13595 [Candidatus Ozemobacteraceae bacterium]